MISIVWDDDRHHTQNLLRPPKEPASPAAVELAAVSMELDPREVGMTLISAVAVVGLMAAMACGATLALDGSTSIKEADRGEVESGAIAQVAAAHLPQKPAA